MKTRILTTLALTAGLMLGMTPAAQAARACSYEGDNGCVWDAKHMGNGVGRSYIVSKHGKVRYISHKRAHKLTHGGVHAQ